MWSPNETTITHDYIGSRSERAGDRYWNSVAYSSSSSPRMLVGSTSRLVAGRKALQTVYWRTSKKGGEGKMIKTGKNMVYGQDTPAAEVVSKPIWVTTNRKINVLESN